MLAVARPRGSLVAAGQPWRGSRVISSGSDRNVALRHVLDAREFSRDWLDGVLFPRAARLQGMPTSRLPKPLLGKRLFYLFYEPSTRTRVSFEMAASLLGAQPITKVRSSLM